MNVGSLADIYAGLQIVTPPASEPVDLVEAESWLRVQPDGSDNDRDVSALLTAVRKYIEVGFLRRALLTQTWKLTLTNWPGRSYQNWPQAFTSQIDQYYHTNFIKLPFPPLQSVTSVSYRTSDGAVKQMTFANYQVLNGYTYNVVTTMEPGRIVLPFAQVWPTDILMPGAPIEIVFVAGYASMAALQAWEGFDTTIRCIKMMMVDCNENRLPPERNNTLNSYLERELAPFRVYD